MRARLPAGRCCWAQVLAKARVLMVRAEALCRRRQLGRHQLHVQLASERIVQPIEQVLRICNLSTGELATLDHPEQVP